MYITGNILYLFTVKETVDERIVNDRIQQMKLRRIFDLNRFSLLQNPFGL